MVIEEKKKEIWKREKSRNEWVGGSVEMNGKKWEICYLYRWCCEEEREFVWI